MGSNISLSIPRVCYRPNEAITVTYNMKDKTYTRGSCWIGLIPININSNEEVENDNHVVSYFYVYADQGSGTLRTLTSGLYHIKCFADDNGGDCLYNKFTRASVKVSVGIDMPCITTNKLLSFPGQMDAKFKTNEAITVSYDLSNCNYTSGSCWIGLIPSHITSTSEVINDQHDVDYFRVSQNMGKGKLSTSRAGKYKIKCFAHDSGGKLLQIDVRYGIRGATPVDFGDISVTIEADDIAQIEEEMRSITSNPSTSRKRMFDLAKRRYKQQGKPAIIDTDNTLKEIKQNARNYKNVALPLTLAQDKPFNTWNKRQFKQDFSRKFNIPIDCIQILSVKAGSTIIDMRINTHWKDDYGKNKSMGIEVIADKIDTKKAKKDFVEFAIFAVEFKPPEAGFKCEKMRVIMNPKWNRAYGPGATDWDGPLKDGKSRGNEPYYCPKGWKRFAVQFKEEALDFAGTYDKWPIAYHGTKFDASMMITLSGLRCSAAGGCEGVHGAGVYLSPSIKYVSNPRYCKPIKLNLDKHKQKWKKHNIKQEHINEFKQYDGKWVQCAFMCRVKPGSYRKCGETMCLGTGEFDGIDLNVIEWIVPGEAGTIIGNEKILIYGIMIRARDKKQTGYHDY